MDIKVEIDQIHIEAEAPAMDILPSVQHVAFEAEVQALEIVPSLANVQDSVVASGSVTLDNTRLDLTATNAFAWLNGVDLSAYQDGNYKLKITDTAGKVASGFIKAQAPTGETLGGNLVTNPSYETDTNSPPGNWTHYTTHTATATIDGTAPDGNNTTTLVATATGYFGTGRLQSASNSIVAGSCFKMSFYGKGISGGTTLRAGIQGFNDVWWNHILTSNWQEWVHYGIIMDAYPPHPIHFFSLSGAMTCVLDLVSLKKITDPPATGVHIVSAQAGATRSWTSEATGFNRNDASGYTYQVLRNADFRRLGISIGV
jgi:hypothetical protein